MDNLEKKSSDEGLYQLLSFIGKSGLGLVPGGSIAAELISMVVADPAGRRRDRLIMEIAAKVEALEAGGAVSLAELADDERVSSIILHAVQVAQRSFGEDKYRALKAATMRGTFDPSARSLSPIVIGVIDRLTDNHLYILNGLRDCIRPSDPGLARNQFLQKYWGTNQPLTQGYVKSHKPKGDGLDPSGAVFKTVWSDLVGLGLIKEGTTEPKFADERRGTAAQPGRPYFQITELTKLVLDHITERAAETPP